MAILGFTLTSSYDYLVFKEQKNESYFHFREKTWLFCYRKKPKWSLAGSNR
jgi:hypothetical protein